MEFVGLLFVLSMLGAIIGLPLMACGFSLQWKAADGFFKARTGRSFEKEYLTRKAENGFILAGLGLILSGTGIAAIIGVPLFLFGAYKTRKELKKNRAVLVELQEEIRKKDPING